MKWKDIKETDGLYEVSSCGKIRRKVSVVKFGSATRVAGGKILSPKTKSNGYLEVSLTNNGVGKSYYVHRLVASNWIDDIKDGFCVNHKDAVKSNNHIDNLEIVTYSENSYHAHAMGLTRPNGLIGSKHPNTNLTEDIVIRMRKEYDNGTPSKDVADMFNVNLSTARKILYKSTWKHI